MDNFNNPFFSICIPNFNYGSFIKETINSVLNQTFSNFEIIIADNCSTDNSLEIIKGIEDERIRLIQNKINVGMSINLDFATKSAKGEFLILLSSDDIMKPSALESYYSIIRNWNYDISKLVIFSSFDIINGENVVLKIDKPSMPSQIYESYLNGSISGTEFFDGLIISGKDAVKVMLQTTLGSTGQFCTTCYSKDLYNRLEGYSSFTSLIADATFVHKLGLNEAMFYYSSKNLFQYRIHESNNLIATQKMSNIKLLIDNYLISQNYDNIQLEKIGLTKESLETTFVNHVVFDATFWSLVRGSVIKGIRLLAFGVSTYPNKVLFSGRFIVLIIMVLFSPILRLIYEFKILIQGSKKK